MHGQPRTAPKPEEAAAIAAKSEKLRSLQTKLLSFHHDHNYTSEAVKTSGELLEINPENYTAWNYRKLAVERIVDESKSDPDAVKKIFDEELRVVESALRQNFKSYGAWHHRKWVLSKGHSSIDRELKLLNLLQQKDPRNFHAWNYRRFVAALMNRSIEDELKHTESVIEANFSNYSAWHNRSILLTELLKKKDEGLLTQDVLSKEYNFVRDALFTDENDQSAWFYHLWLLQQTAQTEVPLLVSSWPVNGADLKVKGNGHITSASSLFSGFPGDLKRFPIVLYFNQSVEGVNSSAVTVEAPFVKSADLTWKPLSQKSSCLGRVWLSYLDLSSVNLDSVPHNLEVRLGHCPGIMSSSGLQLSKPVKLAFTVSKKHSGTTSPEMRENEMFSWNEDDFYSSEGQLEELKSRAFYRQGDENNDEPAVSGWHIDTLTEEINYVRELLSVSNCKIGKLTLARLLTARDAMLSPYANKMTHSGEVLELYTDLIKIDPPHSQYYKDLSSLVLMQQVICSRDSLLSRCFFHKGSRSSSLSDPVCLRLNNLSLSRVGSLEKLLWVQILDLSDNDLHAIEGIEALQLLSCLNLRGNKLTSFSSMEPLRSLKSLRALNISYNEIGSHPIDTCRYQFSSPLSHTGDISWNPEQDLPVGVNVENYWEAFVLFKELDLVQLDIAGNAVADENFQSFLVKICPGFIWLDGQKVH